MAAVTWLPLQQALIVLAPPDLRASYEAALAARRSLPPARRDERIETSYRPHFLGGRVVPVSYGRTPYDRDWPETATAEKALMSAGESLIEWLRDKLIHGDLIARGQLGVTVDSWDAPFEPFAWKFLELWEPDSVVLDEHERGRKIWRNLHICCPAPTPTVAEPARPPMPATDLVADKGGAPRLYDRSPLKLEYQDFISKNTSKSNRDINKHMIAWASRYYKTNISSAPSPQWVRDRIREFRGK